MFIYICMYICIYIVYQYGQYLLPVFLFQENYCHHKTALFFVMVHTSIPISNDSYSLSTVVPTNNSYGQRSLPFPS